MATDINTQLQNISTDVTAIGNLVNRLTTIFSAGGVQNPDIAVMKAELQGWVTTQLGSYTTTANLNSKLSNYVAKTIEIAEGGFADACNFVQAGTTTRVGGIRYTRSDAYNSGFYSVNDFSGNSIGVTLRNASGVMSLNMPAGSLIAGSRATFSQPVVIGFGEPTFGIYNNNLTLGTVPASVISGYINFCDKDGKVYGCVKASALNSAGGVDVSLRATQTVTSNAKTAGVNIHYYNSLSAFRIHVDADFTPSTNKGANLGVSDFRWNNIYNSTGLIGDSDERLKESIDVIPDTILDIWENVQFKQFKFKDAVQSKQNNARLHTGLVAQEIERLYTLNNIDIRKYGFFCYDSWGSNSWEEEFVDQGEIIDDFGREVEPVKNHVETHNKDAGDQYSLRYVELLCIEAAYQRRENARLKARISALENALAVR